MPKNLDKFAYKYLKRKKLRKFEDNFEKNLSETTKTLNNEGNIDGKTFIQKFDILTF